MYTFLGPTWPITCPCFISCPTSTIKLGSQWQYDTLKLSNESVMVYPPAPKNCLNVIIPSWTAINFVPGGAGISIPEWELDAPEVGETLFPNGEVILWNPGNGQKKSVLEK